MDSTSYFETSHFELPGGTLPVRPASSPAPYRQLSSTPRAGGGPERRRTWPNCRNTERVHVGPSQALVLNPTPTSSGCIPHSFPKTRCSKAPNLRVRSGRPESDRYMDSKLERRREAAGLLLSWGGAHSMMNTRGVRKGVRESVWGSFTRDMQEQLESLKLRRIFQIKRTTYSEPPNLRSWQIWDPAGV